MNNNWIPAAGVICGAGSGLWCIDSGPPLRSERIRITRSCGDYRDCTGQNGYRRIKTKADGHCRMIAGGGCRTPACKPETCVAGLFTFSVSDHTKETFKKRESVPPPFACLKASSVMYAAIRTRAVRNISRLVTSLPEYEISLIPRILEPETGEVAENPVCYP